MPKRPVPTVVERTESTLLKEGDSFLMEVDKFRPQFDPILGTRIEPPVEPVAPAFEVRRSDFTSLPDNERSMATIVSRDDVKLQLADLAEIIANGRAVRDSVFLMDAAKRVAALRVTLGL